jgi:phage gp46-like protein
MSLKESNDVVLQKNEDDYFDIVIDEQGDILTDNFLDTSLLRSIYAERRASESEMLVPEQRRGWIGNVEKDFEDGSKVWLFEQARLDLQTINGIKSEIENGLEWLLDDEVAIDFEVDVIVTDNLTLTANIKIQRSSSKVDNQFFPLFENSGKYNYAS